MKVRSLVIFLFFSAAIFAQTTFTTSPQYPTETDQITITFDITHQTKTLVGYTGIVYAHTGVYINNDISSWKYVIENWGNNSTQPQLTYVSPNVYRIVINNPRNFYSITSSSEKITTLNFVLRSSDGLKQTEDIHVPL
ncbi:MAG: alpha-amylase family glycosyl hydrolase, partial [Melioribacteraceae bacterium]